jgi:alpha-tubulin suppressor-like RCC1 family protein
MVTRPQRRILYRSVPPEHAFEERPKYRFELDRSHVVIKRNPTQSENNGDIAVYAVGWGWNSGGRVGNATLPVVREPRQVQRSIGTRYIYAAAGRHHSLLVSDAGLIYSMGEGRAGQLGLASDLSTVPPKGGIVQALPRVVTPSGVHKFGQDLKTVQVACGGSFSVAREMSLDEGIDMVEGLRSMESAMRSMKVFYADSDKMQQSWAHIRHECFRVSRISEGAVTSWGTGRQGQLGLGSYHKFAASPQLVTKLNDVCITKISAGPDHVLAISRDGYIYSWGCGSSGQCV